MEPYSTAIDTVLDYLKPYIDKGLNLREFSPGGGFAIGYVSHEPPPPISAYAETITSMLINKCKDLDIPTPTLLFAEDLS